MNTNKDGNDFYDNKRKYDDNKTRNSEHHQLMDKKRLCESAKKKFQTTMIGILARIEKRLGDMWGHFTARPTNEQVYMQETWQDLRDDILNHGNNQMRMFLEELDDYTVKHIGRYTDFIIKRKDN